MKQKATILIVDDSPENIDVLVGILRDDYIIKVAINGEVALRLVERNPPDLILLDVVMPGMDGYEVCERLKVNKATCDIPIIFITVMDEVVDEQKGLELGAVDYLTKPVKPALVKARVRSHLALYDQSRYLQSVVNKQTLDLAESRRQVIDILGRVASFKDNQTGQHVQRMSQYSRLLALAHGLSEEEAELLMLAAPMHDIGKIAIPDSILLKEEPLTEDEMAVMRMHPEVGYRILGQHESTLLRLASEIALTHHEKFDGTGYPRGLKGEEIPTTTRIVTIVDVFDVLTTDRPYKKARSVSEALAILRTGKGTQFDPVLVEEFFGILDQILEVMSHFSGSVVSNENGKAVSF